jgi:uncharacterized protein YggU (UPF0235/DUF167 family)
LSASGAKPAVARVEVRLHPGAAREELGGFSGGVLRARVSAPPVDGRANRALCRLIARRAGVAPSRVRVIRGKRSRSKLVEVAGIETDELRAALAADGSGKS